MAEVEGQSGGLNLFTSNETATVDKKGRLLLSTKKRQLLGSNFVLTRGDHNCIVAYSKSVYEELALEVRSYGRLNDGGQQYRRLLMGESIPDINCDKEGRFVVPGPLRETANLVEKAIIVGCDEWIEIWAAEEHAIYLQDPKLYALKRREEFRDAYTRMVSVKR
jgi:MraZ protein